MIFVQKVAKYVSLTIRIGKLWKYSQSCPKFSYIFRSEFTVLPYSIVLLGRTKSLVEFPSKFPINPTTLPLYLSSTIVSDVRNRTPKLILMVIAAMKVYDYKKDCFDQSWLLLSNYNLFIVEKRSIMLSLTWWILYTVSSRTKTNTRCN